MSVQAQKKKAAIAGGLRDARESAREDVDVDVAREDCVLAAKIDQFADTGASDEAQKRESRDELVDLDPSNAETAPVHRQHWNDKAEPDNEYDVGIADALTGRVG